MTKKTAKQDANAEPSSSYKPQDERVVTELLIVVPPDGGWGWVVVVGAFFSFFISDGISYTFGVFLEDMSVSLNCTKSQVSLTGATMTGCFCLFGPLIAALINRYGYRLIGITGSILASAACFLTAYANSIELVCLTFGLIGGIGFGMIYIPSIIVVGFYFERWRALATGISVCGSGVGGIVLAPVLTGIIKEHGWRNTFKVLSLMSLGCVVCTTVYKPVKPIKVTIKEDKISADSIDVSEKSGFYTGYHNLSYPTIAEVNSWSSTTLYWGTRTGAESKLATVPEERVLEGPTKWCCRPRRCKRKIKILIKKCCCGTNDDEPPNRPLYRDDVFYSGSLINVPEYRTAKQNESISKGMRSVEYSISVMRTATMKDLYEKEACCPEAIKRTLVTMLSYKLLKSPSFMLVIFNSIFTTVGMYTPYMFIKDRATMNGISEDNAVLLLSTISGSNVIGRMACGILTSLPKMKAAPISYVLLIICGIATAMSSLSFDVTLQYAYAGVFGFSIACTSALRPIIMVETLGLENLTNAIGLVLMVQGFATLTGIATSGFLKDQFGDYTYSFYFAGASIVIGGLVLMPIGVVSKWEQNKSNTQLA